MGVARCRARRARRRLSAEPRMASAVDTRDVDSGIPSRWHSPTPTTRRRLFQQHACASPIARHRARPGPPRRHRVVEPPPAGLLPAACTRSATSRASSTRPDSSSALTCASAMLNLMCGASNERVATAYPASATATASAVRPASAEMGDSTQAISAPTTRKFLQRQDFPRPAPPLAADPSQTSTP